jgi:GNAT superfamily N-acetyltransferase
MEFQNIKDNPTIISFICKLYFQEWKDFYQDNYQIYSYYQLVKKYREWYLTKNSNDKLFLLWHEDKLIGSIGIGENDIIDYQKPKSDSMYITDIFVLPSYRGMGYANLILKFGIDIIKKLNKVVYISVSKFDLIPWYNKNGFRKIDSHILNQEEYIIMELK